VTTRIAIAALIIAATTAGRAAADPPERVARISFLSGTVSFRTAAATDWSPAALNYPITIGDHVWTDRAGRVELQMGATALDLDAMTATSVLNLDHHIVQLRLVQGTAIARVRELAPDESLEIDTPNGAITLVRPGLYRIDVPATGDQATLTVRRGDAEIAAGATAFPVHGGQSVTMTGLDAPAHALVAAAPLDEFEDWALFRDRRGETLASVRYVPRAVVGYEDLDEFGTWRVVAEYGPVWVPHVRPAWAPYRFGHWAWVDPWGWTWIDDAPWGFAPFHYGRWAYVGDGWAWVPGTIVARPVYAPALVAFVGGSNWRIGVNVGAPVGWFPLGPREVFVPAYTVSPAYVVAMNRPHVSVTTVNVNVTNVTYVNRNVQGAMTIVPRDAFTQARPVAAAAVAITPQAASAAVVVGHAAPREIAPVAVVRSAAVVAPPQTVMTRTVVVRTPPPATATTAAAVRRAAASVPAPVAPSAPPPAPAPVPVRTAPPAAAVTRAAPDRAAADVAARHAQERVDVEARHAAERADLQARQIAEARRLAGAQAQAETHARHAREQADLDARQKREHEQMQRRQESERRGRQ
jgi:uncharacterized protein DUF6600